jgi:dipeptidase E
MPIVAIGGYPTDTLVDYVLAAARGRRVLFVATASMESPAATLAWYERLRGRVDALSHLQFHPWPPRDLRALTLAQDVVLVGGGNTANMLAIWRAHGFDRVLRDALADGVLLCGWSAGAICWFEAGVTDSYGPQLEAIDCLGFVGGSACPHYDGEPLRRPRYAELVAAGLPAGIAIDDAAAVVVEGGDVVDVISSRAGARAYRVSREGEQPLEARVVVGAGENGP